MTGRIETHRLGRRQADNAELGFGYSRDDSEPATTQPVPKGVQVVSLGTRSSRGAR